MQSSVNDGISLDYNHMHES